MNPWVQRLFSCAARPRVSKDLQQMKVIDAWQNHPHRSFPSVHVAGTNGKGSVSLKIASALTHTGFKVGLYTSPHISTYRERIQINGALIDENFVLQFLPKLFAFVDQMKWTPSFFELLTALAFQYFAEQKIDIAVIETGLGGQFDATNIITPTLSVITSIENDHADVLGSTLDQIAAAKAGIIKKGVPVVIGPRARFAPIVEAAQGSAIFAPEGLGYYDHENSALARSALEALHAPEPAIEEGLSHRPPCRFQIVNQRPVVLDVAHNPDGFAHLRQAWEYHYPGMRFHLVIAMGKNRDPAACIRQLGDLPFRITCVSNDQPKLVSAQDLALYLQAKGWSHVDHSSLKEAFAFEEPTLITGTFYIMSDARRLLGIEEERDPILLTPIRSSESTIEMEKPLD